MATYILFSDSKSAYKHRSNWGGWLALDNLDRWHWFCNKFTPTKVIMSEQLRGLSAKLF